MDKKKVELILRLVYSAADVLWDILKGKSEKKNPK